MKTKESIRIKWEKKAEDMRKKADFKYNILIQNRKKSLEKRYEYEWEKNERKKMAYIRKKEAEYKRKMQNEIRELQNKPKRVYKSEWPNIKPLQFAMKLAQENARLRDTDKDGRWYCISCNAYCEWEGLAGWHRYSRQFTNMCLEPENINAQCHNCNKITWPLWNPVLKMKTNDEYDRNIVKKFWEWAIPKLKWLVVEFTHRRASDPKKWYDLKKKIPQLIKENEKLWAKKSDAFRATHKPYRNWRKTWEEYDKRH